MKTIHKYEIEGSAQQSLLLPVDAHVVLFNRDGNGMRCFWVELDTVPSLQKVSRTFVVYGTGSKIGDNDLHHGSFVTPEGYVWHLYECV